LTEKENKLDGLVRFLETDNGQRLAIVVYSVIATAVLVAMPGTAAAFALGLPYMFFVTGFAVVRLFFWKGTSLEARFVLSLGLSVLVLIFLGLILVFSVGLFENTTRASLIIFTLGAVVADLVKSRFSKEDEDEDEEAPKRVLKEEKLEPLKFDKVVAAMIGTALVVSAVCIGLIITAEYPSRTYFAMTENGSADIEGTRALNSSITLTIEMHNGEDGPRVFSMVAYGWNTTQFGMSWYNYTLQEGRTAWENVTFDLNQTGVWRLDFDLYISGEGVEQYHYGNLHLWISVEE